MLNCEGPLKHGCQGYGFRYRVRPGPPDVVWAAEFFLVGPGREGLGTVAKAPEAGDPRRGRGRYELCHAATRPAGSRFGVC